jgi:mevalonate pyrophosphate decarboxylase
MTIKNLPDGSKKIFIANRVITITATSISVLCDDVEVIAKMFQTKNVKTEEIIINSIESAIQIEKKKSIKNLYEKHYEQYLLNKKLYGANHANIKLIVGLIKEENLSLTKATCIANEIKI